MKNLWEKDRKTIFRELKQMYLDEGFTHKEAKRLAEQETSLLDAKDYMENIQLLLSHLKFKIKKSICTKTSEYFSIDSKPRTYFKMVEKL